MNIVSVQHHDEEELISRLREVTLLKNPGVKVYRDAEISLRRIPTSRLAPAQRYVLSGELKKVRELRWALQEQGRDVFALEGYVTLRIEDVEEPLDLLPIVVEESVESDGSVHYIINDGMHRAYMAYLEWVLPQVVFARRLPPEYPYYAYPLPGGFPAVELVDELPENLLKKWHRIREYKTLYRDFNSAFNNVGAPRGRTTKSETTAGP